VWPDEGNRLQLLRAALEVAHHSPLQVIQGDLRTDLRALVARMPADATRVVFHTAVLGYLSSADERSAFSQAMKDLEVVWISNEPPAHFPDTTQGLSKPWPLGLFLLSMNRRPDDLDRSSRRQSRLDSRFLRLGGGSIDHNQP
jgi:hypothetical protein